MSTVPFPLLADPRGYVACRWELTPGSPRLAYWIELFRSHFVTLLAEAAREEADRNVPLSDTRPRLEGVAAEFNLYLDQIAEKPDRFGRPDIISICVERERILRQFRIADPYRLPKTRQNEIAQGCLPSLLRELDALDDAARAFRLTEGVFAGNIFDLGATQTVALFANQSVDFHAVRRKLAPRPWLVDHADDWLAALNRPHRAAVLFVDNAGSDVLLGMLPLARELLRRGTKVILTANTTPTLNDVTHDELTSLIQRITPWDAPLHDALHSGRLELVASGNGVPLIDLSKISPALALAVERHGVDLVVLEGMGRAIESNFDARFRCDVLKIAMVKDRGVAEELSGKMYDLVLKFENNS